MPKQVPVRPAEVAPTLDEDRRERLIALRDRLAEAIETAGHRDLAPLSSRYQSVLTELASLPAVVEGDDVDDLAARRARRRSKPAPVERSASS